SYIWPLTIKTYHSEKSGKLYIRYFLGKKVLDCQHTNYSYGGLQSVLKRALELLPFKNNTGEILILGVGAGSVIETIRTKFKSNSKITGVEWDEKILAIAQNEFGLVENENTRLIQKDALHFLENSTQTFDLIIVDLFIADTIPAEALSDYFLQRLCEALLPGGQIIYNTIPETLSSDQLQLLIYSFESRGLHVRKMKKWGYSNNILFADKLLGTAEKS
ncbi:MAG: methyltransferase domain-containing protein, partial [Sediminibacterium sp.]|nr:methyltransferase domain-containing protein [Sediminibacterium sp.]